MQVKISENSSLNVEELTIDFMAEIKKLWYIMTDTDAVLKLLILYASDL